MIDTTGGSGGDVTITATTDGIELNASSINSGGLIDLNAAENINIGDLVAETGVIAVDSVGIINTGSLTTLGANITISGESLPQTVAIAGDVSTNGGDFSANSAGDIEFSTPSGLIATSDGFVELTADGAVFLPEGGIFTTGGNLIINGTSVETVAGNSTVIDTTGGSGGDVTITATTEGIGLNASSINSGGLIDLNAATNITTGNLDTSSEVSDGGDVTLSAGESIATGSIATSSGVTGGEINLTAPSVTSGSINATGSLSSGNITVTANRVDFTSGTNSIISQGAQLQLQSINPADDFAISSADGVTSAAIAALGEGFSEIIIGRDDGSSTLTVESAASFSDPVTFLVPSGTIIVDAQLTGTDNAAITITGSGATTTLNASIITDNTPVTIDGNVIIGSEVAINTVGTDELGAEIIIGGEINGIEPGVGNLELDAGSQTVTLGGAIGSNAALNSLEIDAASIFLSGNTVVTVNGQDFDGFLEVTGDTSFQSNADGDENGTFNAATIQAPGHTITLSAASIDVETINTSSPDSNGGDQILTATYDDT
ncbi:hypothetical protein HC928_25135, partial [bacterium]|nr:hypothetical protein [bacterium]